MRAINLYCDLVADSVLDGLQAELSASGADVGARSQLPAAIVPEGEPVGSDSLVEPAASEMAEAEAIPAAE